MSHRKVFKDYPGGKEFALDVQRAKRFQCMGSFDTQPEAERMAQFMARSDNRTYRVRDQRGFVVFLCTAHGSWSNRQPSIPETPV